MRSRRKQQITETPRGPQTTANSVVGEWLKKETQRLSNLETVGDSDKISPGHGAFVECLRELLVEHDKLLKYARLTVMQWDKEGFEYNVNAIRSYLVEELGIEL